MSLKDNWQMSIGTSEVVHELRLKRGKPIGSKDVPPQKRRTQMSIGTLEEVHDKKIFIIIVKANWIFSW